MREQVASNVVIGLSTNSAASTANANKLRTNQQQFQFVGCINPH